MPLSSELLKEKSLLQLTMAEFAREKEEGIFVGQFIDFLVTYSTDGVKDDTRTED